MLPMPLQAYNGEHSKYGLMVPVGDWDTSVNTEMQAWIRSYHYFEHVLLRKAEFYNL